MAGPCRVYIIGPAHLDILALPVQIPSADLSNKCPDAAKTRLTAATCKRAAIFFQKQIPQPFIARKLAGRFELIGRAPFQFFWGRHFR